MPNWTDEQKNAIKAYNHPTIVSAAAGSGKTAVLVERTVRLLSDRQKDIPADSLLAATFTNDAASQMREKLTAAFEDLIADNPDDEWLLSQHSLLRLAEITTINSFCYGIVKDNLEKTPFRTGVRIMEPNEVKMLTDRALTEVLEERYQSAPDEMEWLISCFCKENDSNLRTLILKLHDFLRTLPYRDLWISRQLNSLRDGSASQIAKDELRAGAVNDLTTVRTLVTRLRFVSDSLLYHAKAKAFFEQTCDNVDELSEVVADFGWDAVVSAVNSFDFGRRPSSQTKEEKANNSNTETAVYESAVNIFNSLKADVLRLKSYFKYPDELISSDAVLVADAFQALCGICKSLDENLLEKKIEKNAVDFADTELITVGLLTEIDENSQIVRTPLCEEMVSSQRYKLIIIDEFQDVNDLQNVIFKSISDTDDLNVIGKNVFVVGDAKQAIYRFRRSNPTIFTNTRLDAKREETGVREVLLTKNFRSRYNVLDFSNFVFSALMSTQVGEIDYNEDELLNLGASYDGEDPATEIIFIDSDADEDDDAFPGEFAAVAGRIRQLLDEGATVKDGDRLRPCVPGDFCVLTRDNIKDSSLVDSFKAVGLNVVSNDRSGYLKSREISLLLNLLSCVCTPMRDIPMAGVMLSPILGFNDDELSLVKLHSKYSRLYRNMLSIASSATDLPKELVDKCKYAIALFKRLRVYSAGMSLTALIKKVYDETDIFCVTSAYDDSARRMANLQLLLEYAQGYEDSSNDGIAGFLRYIDYISKSGGDFEQAYTVNESENAVTVKTIHKSKGLEFPFVFICQTGKQFNKKDTQGNLHLNSQGGVGINLLDQANLVNHTTVFADRIRMQNSSESLSEALRLMYVALTRAKERLFIVLNKSEKFIKRAVDFAYSIDDAKISPAISSKADRFADWLYMAILSHPNVRAALSDRLPDDLFDDMPNMNYPRLYCHTPLNRVSSVSEEYTTAVSPDAALSGRLKEAFSFEYDKRLVENEAKLTVTELIKEEYLDFFAHMPTLGEEFTKLTPAQKGTLTHRFMQLCDFKLAATCVDVEIRRLVDNGQFTPEQADGIDKNAVSAFFESVIYRRMSASGNVMREKQFIVRFDDIDIPEELAIMYKGTQGMLQGIADCVFEEDDGYVLVDYKTDKVRSPQELLDRYAMQLSLYKAAFGAVLDKPVKSAYIYSFRLSQGVEVFL